MLFRRFVNSAFRIFGAGEGTSNYSKSFANQSELKRRGHVHIMKAENGHWPQRTIVLGGFTMSYRYLPVDRARAYCEEVFLRHGFTPEECKCIVDVILTADLYGIE